MYLKSYRRYGGIVFKNPICGGKPKYGRVNCGEFLYNGNMKPKLRKWLARILIGIVVFFNLDAAFSFMLQPERYTPGFELAGVPGQAVIQGMGVLFLMWNVPYIVALLDPSRHFVSLFEALVMQAIGVLGESIILLTLQGVHPLIEATAIRFIIFDGGGLVLLLIAFWITWRDRKVKKLLVE